MAADEKPPAEEPRADAIQRAAADWARAAFAEAENVAAGNHVRAAELMFEQAEIATQASQKMVRIGLIALLPKRQLRPKA